MEKDKKDLAHATTVPKQVDFTQNEGSVHKMGLDAIGLAGCSALARQGDLGVAVTLGRQRLSCSQRDLKTMHLENFSSDFWAERLLMEGLGAQRVESIDASDYEGASITADLNAPIDGALTERFDTVIDLGTTEHIFNVAQVYANIQNICKPGGRILNVVPCNQQCGHGLFQFSPEFFFSVYSEPNGFLNTQVYVGSMKNPYAWVQVDKPYGGRRISVWSRNPTNVIVFTTREDRRSLAVSQSDYEFLWTRTEGSDPSETGISGRLKSHPATRALGQKVRRLGLKTRRLFVDPVVEVYGISIQKIDARYLSLTKSSVPKSFGANDSREP